MKRNIVLLAFLVLSLSSCAYFKRKSCESTNWFEHGKQVALRGLRLSGDDTVEQCRKVEADISDAQLDLGWKAGQAEFCTLAGAYHVGREGRAFNGEICNPSDLAKLIAENKKGIRGYCTPENAEELGREGKTYEKICPDELLKNFVLAYNKGRKTFLTTRANQLKSDLMLKENDLRFQQGRLEGYNANARYAEGRLHGLSINATPEERSSAQVQYDSAQSDAWNAKNAVNSLENSISIIRTELNETERELSGL